jgi:hypothetical protein
LLIKEQIRDFRIKNSTQSLDALERKRSNSNDEENYMVDDDGEELSENIYSNDDDLDTDENNDSFDSKFLKKYIKV